MIKVVLKALTLKMGVFFLMGAAFASSWPVGNSDTAEAVTGQALEINPLTNDVGEGLFIRSVNESSVGWGTISISENGQTLIYTPRYGFSGIDEFWYVLEDEQGRRNAAKVNVEVEDLPWPIANRDVAFVKVGEVVTIPVLANDDGHQLEIKTVSVNEWSTNNGKIWLDDANNIQYQQLGEPDEGRANEFWYVMEDSAGRKNAAKVDVYIERETTLARLDYAVAKNGLRAIIPVLENDTGEGIKLLGTESTTQNGGTSEVVGNTIRYTPAVGYRGRDLFSYTIQDDQGEVRGGYVRVEITENTELSVVAFCGKTYQTDGTVTGTLETTLSPALPSLPDYNVVANESSELGAVSLDNRRYFLEGESPESATLFMDIDGLTKRLAQSIVGGNLYLLGGYNKHIYYSNGANLYAHDGEQFTDLGSLFKDYAQPSENGSPYRVKAEATNNALYIKTSITNPDSGLSEVNEWRISDGLDLNLFWRGSYRLGISSYFDSWSTNISALTYFNGFEYRFRYPYELDEVTYKYMAEHAGEGILYSFVSAAEGAIFEDRNRLFVSSKSHLRSGTVEPAKLYVIDNRSGGFVELLSCDSNQAVH